MLIVIDGLHRLHAADGEIGSSGLQWLPLEMPPNVWLIVGATVPDAWPWPSGNGGGLRSRKTIAGGARRLRENGKEEIKTRDGKEMMKASEQQPEVRESPVADPGDVYLLSSLRERT